MCSARKHFCAYVADIETISSTIHTEDIVMFPVQQRLRENATYLRNTTSHYVQSRGLTNVAFEKKKGQSEFYNTHNNVLQ